MLAVFHGGAPPLWATIEQAAEAWGTAPWIVAEHPGALEWLARKGVLDKHLARKAEIDRGRKT